MSGQSSIDHPLCEECTDTLLDQLDQQLKITDDELKDYKVFLNKLNDKPSLDGDALSRELEELRKEEEELIKKLEEIEMERGKVAEKMESEKERSKLLEIEEKKYWMEYSKYQKELLEYEDEQHRLVILFKKYFQHFLTPKNIVVCCSLKQSFIYYYLIMLISIAGCNYSIPSSCGFFFL